MEEFSFEQLVQALESKVTAKFEEYIVAHRDLEPFTQSPLESDQVPQANAILEKIQSTFTELYPVLHWILQRAEHAKNSINAYNDFIDKLKAGGATYKEKSDEAQVNG